MDKKYYPFGRGKLVIKFPESVKIGLDTHEVETLEALNLESVAHRHVLNVWLVSYYFAGMWVSDVLRLIWADLQTRNSILDHLLICY